MKDSLTHSVKRLIDLVYVIVAITAIVQAIEYVAQVL